MASAVNLGSIFKLLKFRLILIRNQQVGGSSPLPGSIKIKGLGIYC